MNAIVPARQRVRRAREGFASILLALVARVARTGATGRRLGYQNMTEVWSLGTQDALPKGNVDLALRIINGYLIDTAASQLLHALDG
jgi:hypothetical protein